MKVSLCEGEPPQQAWLCWGIALGLYRLYIGTMYRNYVGILVGFCIGIIQGLCRNYVGILGGLYRNYKEIRDITLIVENQMQTPNA